MKKARQTCYMCSQQATSREHVPPKCIFPELKDLPVGFDLRRNLISVPSCDAHNSEKSHDDEYLLFLLSTQHYGNFFKYMHFESKVMRAFNRSPNRFIDLMQDLTPVKCVDVDGEEFDSALFKVDLSRFDRIIHHIACGIFFHHHKEKWLGTSSVLTNLFMPDGDNATQDNQLILDQTIKAARSFDGLTQHGENPDIFHYQIYSDFTKGHAIRLVFFEGAEILVLLQ